MNNPRKTLYMFSCYQPDVYTGSGKNFSMGVREVVERIIERETVSNVDTIWKATWNLTFHADNSNGFPQFFHRSEVTLHHIHTNKHSTVTLESHQVEEEKNKL